MSLNGCSGVSHNNLQQHPGQHVVIIFQENRSTDNLFQDPVLIGRGADIAQSGLDSLGNTITLSSIDLGTQGANPDFYDLSHSHPAFEDMYDGGKMDGANLIPVTCDPGVEHCPPPTLPPHPQYMFVNPADVQPYFQLAEQYAFADRMFQTNQGPSFPAHQFILSGTSAPAAMSNLFASENVSPGTGAGCIAPPGNVVRLIDPSGVESSAQYPCFEHPTLTDLLDAKSVSWRY